MKILYIINHAAFFVSHRKIIADKALFQGNEVSLITGYGASTSMEDIAKNKLKEANIPHTIIPFSSGGLNAIKELFALLILLLKVRKIKPDIIHTASPKGNLYGGLAALASNTKSLIISISGQGFINTESKSYSAIRKTLRGITNIAMSIVFKHPNKFIIVQNEEDQNYFKNNFKLHAKEIIRINGSGVTNNKYVCDINAKEKIVLVPSRLLIDKGINEFVQAYKVIRKKHNDWRFIIAGSYDYKSPASIPIEKIKKWMKYPNLDIPGYVENINELYQKSSIVCLPSYREGFPKCLMEASAAGCAIVTSDVVGCRDAVLNGKTGVLINPREPMTIALAIESLINDKNRRHSLGLAARKNSLEFFDQEKITDKFISLYNILHNR